MKLSREQWLTEISDFMLADIFLPACGSIRASMKLKLSVGFPPGRKSTTTTIGVCFNSEASSEGFNEIFISPVIDDSIQVLETLVHEIVHAIDDCKNGHRGYFAQIARKVGLKGRLTATHANDELRAQLQSYIDIFGDIPHASMNDANPKRQTNRQLKVWCDCGFKFNTSRAQINHCVEQTGLVMCSVCTNPMQFDV